MLGDLEAGRLRVLKVLQDTYGKKGASKIYNRITGYIENYLRATDKFKTRQEEINSIYGADTLPLSSDNSSTTDIEDDKDGIGDDKKKKGKRSLSSDETYLKAKAELRDRQMKGDIASEEEYSRLLLALEIKTLEDRIAANKEKGADLAKLQSELAEKEY